MKGRTAKKYEDPHAWHNEFYQYVTSKIDEETFRPLFKEGNMGAPNASMQYPLISEYIDAIISAEDNMATLNNLSPVLDERERPVMSSGNFAVVFKMKSFDSGRCYAIKCFIKVY